MPFVMDKSKSKREDSVSKKFAIKFKTVLAMLVGNYFEL